MRSVAREKSSTKSISPAETELLQSRAYCRAMESVLVKVLKNFPGLATEAVTANAMWRSSPFARGVDAIDADIKANSGGKGIIQFENTVEIMEVTHLPGTVRFVAAEKSAAVQGYP